MNKMENSSLWWKYQSKSGQTLFIYNKQTGEHKWPDTNETIKSKKVNSEWTEFKCKSGQTLFQYNKRTGDHRWPIGDTYQKEKTSPQTTNTMARKLRSPKTVWESDTDESSDDDSNERSTVGCSVDKFREKNKSSRGKARDEKHYICKFCQRHFFHKTACHRHQLIHVKSKQSVQNSQQYPSKHCFSNINACVRHEIAHFDRKQDIHDASETTTAGNSPVIEKEKSFTCNSCAKSFFHKTACTKHELTHINTKPNNRKSTEQVSNSSENITNTLEVLNKQKIDQTALPFHCKYCKTCFPNETICERHERTHTDAPPFICHYCCKVCSSRDQWQSHELTHEEIKPFKCRIYGKRFTNKNKCNS